MKKKNITIDHLSPIDKILLIEIMSHLDDPPIAYISIEDLSKYYEMPLPETKKLIETGMELGFIDYKITGGYEGIYKSVSLTTNGYDFNEKLYNKNAGTPYKENPR